MWAIARGRTNLALIRKRQKQKFIRELASCFEKHDHYCIDIKDNKIIWCEKHTCPNTKIVNATESSNLMSGPIFIINFTQFLKSHGHNCITYTNETIKWCGKCSCVGDDKQEKGCFDDLFNC